MMRSFYQRWVLDQAIRRARRSRPGDAVPVTGTLREPQGVLVVPGGTLADALHALPVIRTFRQASPGARISVLAHPDASDLLGDAPGLDEALLCYPLAHPSAWKPFRELVSELRSRRFDLLVSLDAEYDRVRALTGFLSRATVRLGYGGGRDAALYNVRVDEPREPLYRPERNLALLRAVGIETQGVDVGWFPPENERRIARQLSEIRNLRPGGPLIGLEGAVDPADRRPAEWGETLRKTFGARLLVVRESPPAAASWNGDATAAMDLGCRTLGDMLALLSTCDLFVAEDRSLLHFAVAMGVATLAVLPGSTRPERVPPESARVVRLGTGAPSAADLRSGAARLLGAGWPARESTGDRPS
jgi:ADP-heptose:LPS heptosyltransferase